jgi:hypothetical protein
MAMVFLGAMTYILRRWYGQRTAVIGFMVLATSAALLHAGRLGDTTILYLTAIPLLLSAHIALVHAEGRKFGLLYWLFASVMLLYVPGMVWLVLLQIIWQWQVLIEELREHTTKLHLLIGLLAVVGLAPLVYGFSYQKSLAFALSWTGLPTELPTWIGLGKDAAASVLFVIFQTPLDPVHWLGTLPLLGAFMLLCFVAGIVFYGQHIRAERTQLLLLCSLLSFVLVTAGGLVSRALLVPLIYIVAFGGIAYVLHFWLRMFPSNQTARRLGIVLISIALLLTMTYNLRHYFVAWPHSPETRAVFMLPPR